MIKEAALYRVQSEVLCRTVWMVPRSQTSECCTPLNTVRNSGQLGEMYLYRRLTAPA